MQTHCPYCHSTQVHRVFVDHSQSYKDNIHSEGALRAKLGLSRLVLISLSRSRGIKIAPWVIGLGEVLLKSLLQYLLDSQKRSADSGLCIEFYCEQCKRCFR